MGNLKINDTNLQNRDSQTQKMNLWLTGGRDSERVWEGHIHVAMFKVDNQKGSTVQQACGTLLNVMCQSGWEGDLGENRYMYMYD